MPRGDLRVIKGVVFIPDGLKIRVMGDLSDGCRSNLFSYYPDELSFTEDELVGLTVNAAIDLFVVKDTHYLQS